MEFNENSCSITFASGHPLSTFKCSNVSTYVSVAVSRMNEGEGRCAPYIDLALVISSVLKI